MMRGFTDQTRVFLALCVLTLVMAACGPRTRDASAHDAPAADTAATETLDGRALFESLHCIECHQMNGNGPGPSLVSIEGTTIALENGAQVTVDEAYIRTAILDPRAQIHAGYPPIMPNFANQLDEQEVAALVHYILTLQE